MPELKTAPYGSWRSPVTSDLIVAGTIRLSEVSLDGADVYWLEGRPLEGGRNVLVRRTPGGTIADVTPTGFNVRTRVHEYGGGAYLVVDGTVYFANYADQRLYRQEPGGRPVPISPEAPLRYADMVLDAARHRLICVCEDHSGGGEPANLLAAVPVDGKTPPRTLASGNDFYSTPRLSPDGTRLAWLTWNHPNMPWDGTELWVAELTADGAIGERRLVAGGLTQSVFQPEWAPDGRLYFVADPDGWWNLYREGDDGIEAIWPQEAEFGLPQWVFRLSTYGFEATDRLISAYNVRGTWGLAAIDAASGTARPLETPYTGFGSLRVAADRIAFIGGAPDRPDAVVLGDPGCVKLEVLRSSSEASVDQGYLSLPEAISFPSEHELTAHGFYYPPRNQDYRAPAGELPPLIVVSHGGPTGSTSTRFDLMTQYWTSRGFAVLDVNYGGSTSYGREYRERLKGQWGVVDVDDCVNGAQHLADLGLVDERRLLIRGGSAGGYTTLCALVFRSTFAAGASYYGISDLEALVRDSHKFESRYEAGLIGPYPECRDLYIERSPIHSADRLNVPVIFFQGLEDLVVPPNQAEMMVNVLKLKGLPVAYIAFEGEQHGFRRAENIKRSLDAELYFYAHVLNFPLGEPLEPVEIFNLG